MRYFDRFEVFFKISVSSVVKEICIKGLKGYVLKAERLVKYSEGRILAVLVNSKAGTTRPRPDSHLNDPE